MPNRLWTVTRHDPIAKLEDNLWAVEADIPGAIPIRRRASFVKLGDGRLVVHNAVPLEDAAQAEVERWGEPAFLVLPNRFHCIDAHAYKERYPRLRVVCPEAQRRYISERVAVDGTVGDLPRDPALDAEVLDGLTTGEAALAAHTDGRTSLIFGDVYFNVPARLPGGLGLVIHLLGSTGGPRVTRIARWLMVGDRRKLRAHLERLAERPGLSRLIPSHGDITGPDAARATLLLAAATL
jgi:hypothetical protein